MPEHKQGVCPKCGSKELVYDPVTMEPEGAYAPYVCLNCGFYGEEWYHLEFLEHRGDFESVEPKEY